MRLHRQTGAFLLEPSTAVTVMQFNKVEGAVVFIKPVELLQAMYRNIDQHHAARPKNGVHASVIQSNAPVSVVASRNVGVSQKIPESSRIADGLVYESRG